jgi:pimeloyl-ACP methyl ester carboxylesterase
MGRSVEPDTLATRLGAIHCPVLLLLGGAHHPGGPPSSEVTTMRRGLAEFTVDTIPGAGHFLQEEAPRRVAAVIDSVAAALPNPSTGGRP